jgi:cell division protein ZapA (FtsZ GTPase activity inhibitor)
MADGIELHVAGQTYRVNSSETAETLHSLAAELEQHVAALTIPGRQPPNGVLLLAALGLVHALRNERAEKQSLERKTRDLLRRALSRIEHALETEPNPTITGADGVNASVLSQ